MKRSDFLISLGSSVFALSLFPTPYGEKSNVEDNGMFSDKNIDVAVIGGGTAGLSTALILGRSLRKVIVFDGGEPRNAPSPEAHSVFTRDGTPPLDLLEIAKQQLKPYNVAIHQKKITDIKKVDGRFELKSMSGLLANAKKVVLTTGVVDILPEIKGIEQFWGKSVLHCPYCHGWEVRNQPIAAIVNAENILKLATLLIGWSSDLVLLTNGPIEIESHIRQQIESKNIEIIEERISELVGDNGHVERVVFGTGESVNRKAVFVRPEQHLRSNLSKQLKLELTEEGQVKADQFGETSVPGIYVAGDAGPNMQQVIVAASTGAQTGIWINNKLLEEEFNQE